MMAENDNTESSDADGDVPTMDDDSAPIKARTILKKKEFMDRAIDRSGLKKADAKAAIDAALAVLAEALGQGDEMILPPLGKLKVTREKTHPKGRILLLRLQLMPEGAGEFSGGTEPLAEAGD
jgi:Bacterial DNA-binding protein